MEGNNGRNGKTVETILRVVGALALLVASYALNTVSDLNTRLAKVEGSRFTSSDGLDVWKEIGRINERVAKLPKEVPPKWLLERMDKIDKRLDEKR